MTGIYVLLTTNQVLRLKQNRSFLIFWVERLMNYHAFDNDDCFQRGVAFFAKLQAGVLIRLGPLWFGSRLAMSKVGSHDLSAALA